MPVKELAHLVGTRFLEALQRRPLQQQIGRQSRRTIIVQCLQGQREVDFKLALDLISQLGPLVHRFAPALVEKGQLAGQFRSGFQALSRSPWK